jgi:hypothetical protein
MQKSCLLFARLQKEIQLHNVMFAIKHTQTHRHADTRIHKHVDTQTQVHNLICVLGKNKKTSSKKDIFLVHLCEVLFQCRRFYMKICSMLTAIYTSVSIRKKDSNMVILTNR